MSSLIKTIKISLAGRVWYDRTNDLVIGNAKDLLRYVNANKMTVENQECFLDSNKFWYNKEAK